MANPIGFLVRADGSRVELDWNDGELDSMGEPLDEDEQERVHEVGLALGCVGLDMSREAFPIAVTDGGEPDWSNVVAAWLVAHNVTPSPRAVVDLVAGGWASPEYRYPCARLSHAGRRMLAREAEAFDEAQLAELVEMIPEHCLGNGRAA